MTNRISFADEAAQGLTIYQVMERDIRTMNVEMVLSAGLNPSERKTRRKLDRLAAKGMQRALSLLDPAKLSNLDKPMPPVELVLPDAQP